MRLVAEKWNGTVVREYRIREMVEDAIKGCIAQYKEDGTCIYYVMTGDTLILATYYEEEPEVTICKVDRRIHRDYNESDITIDWEK